MFYATKPMKKEEIALVRKVSPYAGFLGHSVTGYRETGEVSIESDSEIQCASLPSVTFIRKRQLNGRYTYRRVIERPEVRV